MVKIYKSVKGKLIVYLPFDVVNDLKLKEADEIDFFKMSPNSFIFAKKSDITNMILGKPQPAMQQAKPSATPQMQQAPQPRAASQNIPEEYIAVLKKIDTLRYENRTPENVSKLLNDQEKRTLQKLMAEKFVALFKKNGKETYSIPKDIYDRFLMRKRPTAPVQTAPPVAQRAQQPMSRAPPMPKIVITNPNADLNDEGVLFLEKNGYLVLQTEAEAGRVSMILEDSVRRGQILGTRAFNKKFYIVRRIYFDKNSGGILKKLRDKDYKVPDLAEELSMDEDGCRAILYLLSENGDVTEKRRDTFTIA